MMEKWEDIAGYEELYQVSNLGCVRSRDRVVKCSRDIHRRLKGICIKPIAATNGYMRVALCRDGVPKQYSVHRLVAIAFIPNLHGYNEVNHIDENKTNNTANNLEWVTHRANVMHGTNLQRGVANRCDQSGKNNPMYGRRGINNPQSKPVLQLDSNGNIIKWWSCAAEAGRELGINPSSIAGVARGRYLQAYGFKWKYEL